MLLTFRGTLVLLLAAAPLMLGTWVPALQWAGLAYLLLCVGLLALDWRLAGSVRRFEAARQHDTKLSLGAENPIHLAVRNRDKRRAFFSIRDEPPHDFVVDSPLAGGEVDPQQEWRGVYHVRPRQRGNFAFGDLNLRWRGPLGLVIRQGRVPAAGPVKVYPNLLDVRRYDLLLRQNRLQELGLRHARLLGQGTEFERLREYQPDDDFRRVNWKATARHNRPMTVEYETERSQNVVAVLDTARMMQSPVAQIAKLDYVINAVLLLTYVATGKGDKVGLMTFADEVGLWLNARQGRGQFYRVLETLYAVKPQPVEPDYQRALTYLAAKQRKRALIVIFTDLSSGLSMQSLISHVSVLARRGLPLVVTISDPDLYSAARQTPRDSLSAYQRGAAVSLLDERQATLNTLQRRGILTLDVPANHLSIAVINRYLELKARTRL